MTAREYLVILAVGLGLCGLYLKVVNELEWKNAAIRQAVALERIATALDGKSDMTCGHAGR